MQLPRGASTVPLLTAIAAAAAMPSGLPEQAERDATRPARYAREVEHLESHARIYERKQRHYA